MLRKSFQHKRKENNLKSQVFFDKDNWDRFTIGIYLHRTQIETKEDHLKEDSVPLLNQRVLVQTQELQVQKKYFQHLRRDFISTTRTKWSE